MFGSVSITFKKFRVFGMYSIWGKIKITLKIVFSSALILQWGSNGKYTIKWHLLSKIGVHLNYYEKHKPLKLVTVAHFTILDIQLYRNLWALTLKLICTAKCGTFKNKFLENNRNRCCFGGRLSPYT